MGCDGSLGQKSDAVLTRSSVRGSCSGREGGAVRQAWYVTPTSRERETARQSFATTPLHYRSHPGTRFPVRAMVFDPGPLIAEPRTSRRQDKLVSFGLRPSQGQDIIFALSSPSSFGSTIFPQHFHRLQPWLLTDYRDEESCSLRSQ